MEVPVRGLQLKSNVLLSVWKKTLYYSLASRFTRGRFIPVRPSAGASDRCVSRPISHLLRLLRGNSHGSYKSFTNKHQ